MSCKSHVHIIIVMVTRDPILCEVTKQMDGPETQAMLGHPLTLMMARMRSFSSTAATSLAAALPAAALLVLMNAILRPSSSSASRYSSSTWCIRCSVS